MNLDSLANGLGYIYWTESDGVTVVHNLKNNCDGLLATLIDGVNKAPVSGPIEAIGEIEIVSAAGDNITFVNVDSRNQISGTVATTVGDTEQTARDLRDAINASVPVSGPFYTATANGSKVILHAPVGTGTSVNGHVVVVGVDGASSITTKNIGGATDGNEIASICGDRRYFYDADFGPNDCSGEGTALVDDVSNAREITSAIIMRGEQLKMIELDEEVGANSDNVLEYTRVTNTHRVTANMSGAGSTELHNIIPSDYIYGDTIYLSGASASKVVTLKDSLGNISLTNGVDFVTGSPGKTITLQLREGNAGPVWVEVSRSTVDELISNDSITTAMLQDDSVTTAKIAALAVNSDKLAALSVTAGKIAVDAVSSDEIRNDSVTASKILNLAVTTSKINDLAVTVSKIADGAVTTQKVALNAINADRLDSESQLVTLSLDISAESGETGEYQIPVDFKCDVVKVVSRVKKAVEATDNWTIQPANGAGNMDVTVTHAAGAAFGDTQTVIPTTNTEILAGGVIKLTSSKVTAGGKANIFAIVRRKV